MSEALKEKFCESTVERGLLAIAMHDMDSFFTVLSKMSAKDFLYKANGELFSLLKSMHDHYDNLGAFDLPVVIEEAKKHGIDDLAGGAKYIRAVYNMNVDKRNLNNYITQVLEASTKYKLYLDLDWHRTTVLENSKKGLSSADLIGSVEGDILDLSTSSKAIDEPRNILDGLEEFIEERRNNPIEMSGISTGFPILDKQIDGFIPGTLFVLAARKKEGKSAVLTNMACHAAFQQRLPVLYVDTELTFNEWRTRVLAGMTGVKERTIKHGGYTLEENMAIDKCLKLLDKAKLMHQYMPGYSVDKLAALYTKHKIKDNIGIAFFDYIKEPESSSVDVQRKEYQILGDVTTKLKDLSGKLDIPFVTAVQLNRAGDVADSDRIARYGDIVALWGSRNTKEDKIDEFPAKYHGSHKLVIRDTRRGGATAETGIGYHFKKQILKVIEVLPDKQMVDYTRVINHGSADYEEQDLT